MTIDVAEPVADENENELCPLCPDTKPPSPSSPFFGEDQDEDELNVVRPGKWKEVDLKWLGCTRCDDRWYHAVCLARVVRKEGKAKKEPTELKGSNGQVEDMDENVHKKLALVSDTFPDQILVQLSKRSLFWDYTKYISSWFCPTCISKSKTQASRTQPKATLREDLPLPPLPVASRFRKHPHTTHTPSPLNSSYSLTENGEISANGKTRPKRQAALHQPDYHALHNSIPTPTGKWLNLIADPEKLGRKISDRPYTQMNGADLTKAWLDANEPSSTGPSGDLFYGPNREPIVIPKLMGGFESLGGKVPDAKTGFQDIANLVGRNKTLDVIDVATQKSSQWSLGKWADYISEYREEAQPEASSSTSASSSPPQGKKAYQQRNKVYNVISLEISGTALARKVRPPKLVSEIDWVDKYWPDVPGKRKARRLYHRKAEDGEDEEDEEERAKQVEESIKEEEMLAEQGRADWPKVQLYCLMGMKGSWTDWHVDFAASSVYYTVHTGSKTFFFIRPTAANLTAYSKWSSSTENQDQVWLGDWCDEVRKVTLKAGDTMIIPSGYIHSVYTPLDSLVFGGNFLHSYNISTQTRLRDIEIETKVPQRFRFPFFERLCWYAAIDFLKELRESAPSPFPRKSSIKGSKTPSPPSDQILKEFLHLSLFLNRELEVLYAPTVEEKKRKAVQDKIPMKELGATLGGLDGKGLVRELRWRCEELLGVEVREDRDIKEDKEEEVKRGKKRKIGAEVDKKEETGIRFASVARLKNHLAEPWKTSLLEETTDPSTSSNYTTITARQTRYRTRPSESEQGVSIKEEQEIVITTRITRSSEGSIKTETNDTADEPYPHTKNPETGSPVLTAAPLAPADEEETMNTD